MEFKLNEDQLDMQKMFREFAEKEVKPIAEEIDENERFPEENIPKMAEAGFLGIPVPEEYEGQGGDILTYTLCVEEMSRCCATTGSSCWASASRCLGPRIFARARCSSCAPRPSGSSSRWRTASGGRSAVPSSWTRTCTPF